MDVQRLRKLYNSFPPEGKDMSFEDFCKEYTIVTNPPTPQELMAAQLAKAKTNILMN